MRARLLVCLGVLLFTFLVEFIGGIFTGSLSLVSDSFHVLVDLISLALSYMAGTIALKKMPTDKMTYGYHRLEVFSAIANGMTLIGISIFIILQAFARIKSPQEISILPALMIAIFGLGVNVLCAFILRWAKGDQDLNLKSAYFHLMGDSLASVSVVVGLILIFWTKEYMIDGVIAFLISLWILVLAIRVLAGGAGILLHKSPHELAEIRNRLREITGVIDLDDLRLWQVCSHLIVGTAHVITNVKTLHETEVISIKIKSLLQEQFNVRHMTLQFESPEMAARHTHLFEHKH